MNMTGADDQPVVAGQTIGQLALVVRDYDEAIHFYVDVLGFALIEDTRFPRKTSVGRRGAAGLDRLTLLLARAANDEQASRIGNQTGGRVFLFLHTDDFWRDFHAYKSEASSLSGAKGRKLRHGCRFRGSLWQPVGSSSSQRLPNGREA